MRIWSSGTFGCSLAAFVLSTTELFFNCEIKKRKARCTLHTNKSNNFFSAKELFQNNLLRISYQSLSFNRTDHFTRHKNNEIQLLLKLLLSFLINFLIFFHEFYQIYFRCFNFSQGFYRVLLFLHFIRSLVENG